MRKQRVFRLVAVGLCGGAALLFAQTMFQPPVGAVATGDGPSLYINTYVLGDSFANSVLWFGARNSMAAHHAVVYGEMQSPATIAQSIKRTADQAGEPLRRVTIAGHGKPGGILLNRDARERPEDEWLLASHTLLNWMLEDVADAVTRDAMIVFESCDTNPIIRGAPAAESLAFRRAVARTFDVPPENVVLFRGPAKYAWGFDGWRPRTYPLEIVFEEQSA